jgi:hypothetical protein
LGIAVQRRIAKFLGRAVGVGLGGSISAGNLVGTSASFSRQVVVAPSGQAAFVQTASPVAPQTNPVNALVSPGWGAYTGIQVSFSNAQNLGDLAGPGLDYGYGGGDILGGGIDFSGGSNDQGNFIWQYTVTGGAGFGSAGHGLQQTSTTVTPICGG